MDRATRIRNRNNLVMRATRINGLASLAILAWLTLTPGLWAQTPPEKEGIAIALVFDTSGSMLQSVPDADGRSTPKHVIATRALRAVVQRLQAVQATPESSRVPIHAGLVVFQGGTAEMAIPLGPFRPQTFQKWLDQKTAFHAGTPLGHATELAGRMVLESKLPRKHILVITDGINTKGPDPTAILPKLQRRAEQEGGMVAFHFVAFDVNANVFAGVKKLGATVVGAADEKQLNSQLEFVLAKKILLEDEEPLTTKPKTN